ncbi:MAG: hypothetical protein QRY72_03570 [Candidatus Rhabdochlamydia sp.]
MNPITSPSEIRKEIHDFKRTAFETLEDPVMTGPFIQAVTLFPCGHHLSQEVAQKIFQKNQQCPLDNLKIQQIIPNLLIRDLIALEYAYPDDFHAQMKAKFQEISSSSLLKAVTLFPCGHSANEDEIKTSATGCCPFDQQPITSSAPSHLIRDLAEMMHNHQKKILKLCEGKPPFYFQIVSPLTPLEELRTIPKDTFNETFAVENHNGMAYYNVYRLLPHEEETHQEEEKISLKQFLLQMTTTLEPVFAEGHYELALFLGKKRQIEGLNGPITGMLSLVRALDCDPNHAKSYLTLATTYSEIDSLWVKNKPFLTRQEILLKALHLNPTIQEIYIRLGSTLQTPHEKATLLDGRSLNKGELFEIGASLDLTHDLAYSLKYQAAEFFFQLGTETKNLQKYFPKIQQLCLEAVQLNPARSEAFKILAVNFPSSKTIKLLDGQIMTQKDLILKAIDLDPDCPANYILLATLLNPHERITLLNGTVMSKKDLILKRTQTVTKNSIEDFNFSCLSPSERLSSPAPVVNRTSSQHLGKALSKELRNQNPQGSSLFEIFIKKFPSGETIEFEDGTLKTEREMYQMGIQKYPSSYVLHSQLALLLLPKEQIKLHETTLFDKEQLFLEAIRLNPEYSLAYQGLGACLPKGKIITLSTGKKMGSQQLFLEAIRLMPQAAELYYSLALSLPQGKMIELPSNEKVNKVDLVLKTISLDPSYAKAYHALAEMLPLKGAIQLLTGEKKNRLELYLHAFKINPHYEEFSVMFKAFLPFIRKKESLHLSTGKVLPLKEFFTQIDALYQETLQIINHTQLMNDPSYKLPVPRQDLILFYNAYLQCT